MSFDDFRARLRPVLRKLAPVAKVVEAATEVLGTLQQPTILGVVNGVASGLKTLNEIAEGKGGGFYQYNYYLPYGDVVAAFERAGADIVDTPGSDMPSKTVRMGKHYVVVSNDAEMCFRSDPKEDGTISWISSVLAGGLAKHVNLRVTDGEVISEPAILTDIRPERAVEIWERTRTMLEGGRVIMLEGRPGTGKTTAAQAIAAVSELGRVVMVDSSMLVQNMYPTVEAVGLQMLDAAVIIVDDIDKVPVSIKKIEMLRTAAKLVILTANNGTHDEVLDCAVMRPARIDEVFTIKSEHNFRRPPFDQLDDETWEGVREWPHAWLNELEKRVRAGVDLRLSDLEKRLELRTRSGDALFGDDEEDE